LIDRIDLLIAVIGIVVSVLGSSTAMWMALAKKPDRSDLDRVESRLDAMDLRIGDRLTGIEVTLARIDERLAAVERNP
jgi:hypothetical protein